jgi:hypothetical protein
MRMTRGYARGAAGAEVTPCASIASPRLTVRWDERRSTIGSSGARWSDAGRVREGAVAAA